MTTNESESEENTNNNLMTSIVVHSTFINTGGSQMQMPSENAVRILISPSFVFGVEQQLVGRLNFEAAD